MDSTIATPLSPKPKSEVILIPWDTTSTEHVDRLVQQRIACGWDHQAVQGWKAAQEAGTFNLQWIVSQSPASNLDLLKFRVLGSRRFLPRERC